MNLTIETGAILFSAIGLIIFSVAARHAALAVFIRETVRDYEVTRDEVFYDFILGLKKQLLIIKYVMLFIVLAGFCSVVYIFSISNLWDIIAHIFLIATLIFITLGLFFSALEVFLQTKSLRKLHL